MDSLLRSSRIGSEALIQSSHFDSRAAAWFLQGAAFDVIAHSGRRQPMKKTIRQLREEHGESTMQLADVLGASLQDIYDLEQGTASPSLERLRRLTEHFGVHDEDIDLEPGHAQSLGERLG